MEKSVASALVLCTDTDALDILERVFWQYQVSTEICMTSWAAQKACKEHDFDFLVADFDEADIDPLLDAWSSRGPNASKVVIAFGSSEGLRSARQKHVHFITQKPLNSALIARTLKVAYTILLKKRRADYRVSVSMKAQSTIRSGAGHFTATITLLDISIGGLCVKADKALPKGSSIEIAFYVPGTSDLVHSTGLVAWSEPSGLTGVRFASIPPREMQTLERWLENNDPSKPGQVDAVVAAQGNSGVSGVNR